MAALHEVHTYYRNSVMLNISPFPLLPSHGKQQQCFCFSPILELCRSYHSQLANTLPLIETLAVSTFCLFFYTGKEERNPPSGETPTVWGGICNLVYISC